MVGFVSQDNSAAESYLAGAAPGLAQAVGHLHLQRTLLAPDRAEVPAQPLTLHAAPPRLPACRQHGQGGNLLIWNRITD